MPLVKLQDGTSQWGNVEDAANILWRASIETYIDGITNALRSYYSNEDLNVAELKTRFSKSRRGVVIANSDKITIAFFGSDPDELIRNTWSDGKGPEWWALPYARYDENGNRVHSFFLDMWHDMRSATYDAQHTMH